MKYRHTAWTKTALEEQAESIIEYINRNSWKSYTGHHRHNNSPTSKSIKTAGLKRYIRRLSREE